MNANSNFSKIPELKLSHQYGAFVWKQHVILTVLRFLAINQEERVQAKVTNNSCLWLIVSINLLLFVKKKKNPKNYDHKANVVCCERMKEAPYRHSPSNKSCFMGLTSASLSYYILPFEGMKASA